MKKVTDYTIVVGQSLYDVQNKINGMLSVDKNYIPIGGVTPIVNGTSTHYAQTMIRVVENK